MMTVSIFGSFTRLSRATFGHDLEELMPDLRPALMGAVDDLAERSNARWRSVTTTSAWELHVQSEVRRPALL
jgi:malate synthase